METKEKQNFEAKMSKDELIESLLERNYADPKTAPIDDCCGNCGCQD